MHYYHFEVIRKFERNLKRKNNAVCDLMDAWSQDKSETEVDYLDDIWILSEIKIVA